MHKLWYHFFCLWVKKIQISNAKKFHILLSQFVEKATNIGNFTISCYTDILLGVTIHSNLNFSKPVTYLCATDNRKLHTLSHVSKYILMKSCIISQSSYCPLIWMTVGRGFNNVINHTHERALRIVYKDFSVSFEGLLAKDTSVTIRNRNLQQLVI